MTTVDASTNRETERRLAHALFEGRLDDPEHLLGARPEAGGFRLRAWHPEARACEALLEDGRVLALRSVHVPGLFESAAPLRVDGPPRHRLRFTQGDGTSWIAENPYRFPSTLESSDLYFFSEGTHRGLWHVLGAHAMEIDGVAGVRFAVWAPASRRVSVVGDFCHWDGRCLPMQRRGHSGVFELFVPAAVPGQLYKFEIVGADGVLVQKTDPLAREMEAPPQTASRIAKSGYVWRDGDWMRARGAYDVRRAPVSIYEVHLGSWKDEARAGGYEGLAEALVAHAKRFGFTHLELLPVTEFPFDGSWGYQVSGYFAPTARFGPPDAFRAFVDRCHRGGIGVILDWVPAHFPRDAFALRRFDGTPLYEYADPRIGEHREWGTLVFDFGRNEVRNFLVASALYWLKEFHVDGLRVDAVASMLYRDYGREDSDWLPNVHGGNENLEAIRFLRQLNDAVHAECPGAFTVAEESTAWPGVTRSTHEGGLGFDLKWNMGWMHDTLRYFSLDPVHRRHHQDQLTFASIYEYSEHYLMPLSHDEVVHGKRSLVGRMPGDDWQRLANLRLLFAYQFTRPGKQLLFMGSELAPEGEWAFERELPWAAWDDPMRAALARFLEALGRFYRARPCLWQGDPDPESFAWIDTADHEQSVVSYVRRGGGAQCVVVLNLTPVPRTGYRIGAPASGRWRTCLSTDAGGFGGSGHPVADVVGTEAVAVHGYADSFVLDLPPLAAIVLEPDSTSGGPAA